MKNVILIGMAIFLLFMPLTVEAQKPIKRPSKKKTEQMSGAKPTKQTPAKKRNNSSNSGSSNSTSNSSTNSGSSKKISNRDQILQNLIKNMVEVEGGVFLMGSDDSDADGDEKPVHRVYVGNFSIGRYEVTQKEWNAVMGNNPSKFKGDDLPVENVSWNDCQEFIRKLNGLTGLKFRLPNEEEWEFAARGGNRSNGYKYSGSIDLNRVAWYDGNSGNETHKVGTKEPNELGLYDMNGNVWEWTSSKYCSDYSKPRDSTGFVIRGCGWCSDARRCRVSYRDYPGAATRDDYLGLRLVL